jgi:hypothetical protein
LGVCFGASQLGEEMVGEGMGRNVDGHGVICSVCTWGAGIVWRADEQKRCNYFGGGPGNPHEERPAKSAASGLRDSVGGLGSAGA